MAFEPGQGQTRAVLISHPRLHMEQVGQTFYTVDLDMCSSQFIMACYVEWLVDMNFFFLFDTDTWAISNEKAKKTANSKFDKRWLQWQYKHSFHNF